MAGIENQLRANERGDVFEVKVRMLRDSKATAEHAEQEFPGGGQVVFIYILPATSRISDLPVML